MAESRNYIQDPTFEAAYLHTDSETGETVEAPFAVAVVGIKEEMLGVGHVIGHYEDHIPVIRIEDPAAPEGFVLLDGLECWWVWPVDESITQLIAQSPESFVSAYEYVRKLDATYN